MRTSVLALMSAVILTTGALSAPPVANREPRLTGDEWKGVSTGPLTAAEIDRLIAAEQAAVQVKPAPLVNDEQFIRRVMLDLTGQLPLPADVTEFAADRDPAKRAQLVDRLLESDEYARHWAGYWRDVFTTRVTDRFAQLMAGAFQNWLHEQFQQNRSWDRIARDLITATGKIPIRYGPNATTDASETNGAAYFMLAYQGRDAINDRTSETARIFLGIQIQCAQCHDHPFDGWKQEQFHQLAGYFAKTRERPMFERVNERMQLTGYQVVSMPVGEHRMPDPDDPSRGKIVFPKFLDGRTINPRTTDEQRRQALADAITRDNYWFSAAFVNRMWGELMGRAFCEPIDDMSPGKDVLMPKVLARVAAGFKGSGHDIKGLLRVICTSETYQRQVRPGESGVHTQFAALNPTRLRAESVWQSLTTVLGRLGPPVPRGGGAMANSVGARFSLEGQFKREFEFDPSLPPDDVESSIPQALMLMNNPQIHQRIQVEGTNLLARILAAYPRDDDAVRMVYMRTLARKPTDRERDKALSYIKKVGRRAEAFEDLLWALLNSTEFQTRR